MATWRALGVGILLLAVAGQAHAWGGGGGGGGMTTPPPQSAPPPPRSEPPPPPAPPGTESFVVKALSFHVSSNSPGGVFSVKDSLAQGQTWGLKYVGNPKTEKLDDAHYRVVAAFEGSLGGDASKAFPVLLEFYLTGADQQWQVTDVWIREVNGNARGRTFTCPAHGTVGTFEAKQKCPVDGQALN